MASRPINRTRGTQAGHRVRRGNVADQEALRRATQDAAMRLFQAHGLQGVTMRAVAAEVGVSAMALYRYFPNKAGLLRGLWEYAITELNELVNATLARPGLDARQKLRATIDVFLAYYEARPDYYRLLYMTEQAYVESEAARWVEAPVYREVLSTTQALSREVALEVGGQADRARLASDLRHALCTGYLHARLINTRYPWQDLTALREQAVEQIATSVENCLKG